MERSGVMDEPEELRYGLQQESSNLQAKNAAIMKWAVGMRKGSTRDRWPRKGQNSPETWRANMEGPAAGSCGFPL